MLVGRKNENLIKSDDPKFWSMANMMSPQPTNSSKVFAFVNRLPSSSEIFALNQRFIAEQAENLLNKSTKVSSQSLPPTSFEDLLPNSSTFHRISIFENLQNNDSSAITFPEIWFKLPASLCGFPSFCSLTASSILRKKRLNQLDECDMNEGHFFVAVCILLGCFIVLGNGLVLWNVCKKQKGFEDNYSKVKGSLAIADMLTGVQLFGISVYNYFITINSSVEEVVERQRSLHGTPQAIAAGSFLLFNLTSSIYHLALLGCQRLIAIKMPIQYKLLRKRTMYYVLGVVWVLAIISASMPAWFPNELVYTYYHTLFLFYPAVRSNAKSLSATIVMFILFYGLPYLVMISSSILCAVFMRSYYKKTSIQFSASRNTTKNSQSVRKREKSIFVTVILMQVGFSLTLVPVIVVAILVYTNYLTCNNFSRVYIACIYLAMANSLVNVLVYSVREKKFRMSLKNFLCNICRSEVKSKIHQNKKSTKIPKILGKTAMKAIPLPLTYDKSPT
ncbi:unnamed protein product [Clavelina lepadiformis]|uniref:G-protein coupled receptors family 1 profile domain-containing protein n=1 Tax=Clavelina lepadiformis TaxID=159417 RepID=A0ABP0FEG4_CLALP